MRKYIDLLYSINKVKCAQDDLRSAQFQAECAAASAERVKVAGFDGYWVTVGAERLSAAVHRAAANAANAARAAAIAEARALDAARQPRDRRARREAARLAALIRARARA